MKYAILFFPLLFFSCGGTKQISETDTEEISTKYHVLDSLKMASSFMFDELDIWFDDTDDLASVDSASRKIPKAGRVKHVKIRHGKTSKEVARSIEKNDSTHYARDQDWQYVKTSQGCGWGGWDAILVCLVILAIFILYRKCENIKGSRIQN